jgi:hypothetical protein
MTSDRWRDVVTVAWAVVGLPALAAAEPEMTLSFAEPRPVVAAGAPLAVAGHAATRCIDWDGDGRLDLLVGGGDGRVWVARGLEGGDEPAFAKPVAVTAGGRDRWGAGLTGALLVHVVGDPEPDLVVGHSGDEVAIHENTGSRGAPVFAETALTVTVQDGCHGRIDVADWNADGQPDLVTGSFRGAVEWHENGGRADAPRFAAGVPLDDVTLAYNAHPRVVDVDRNGTLDLLLGVNWGTVTVFRNEGTAARPRLHQRGDLRRAADGGAVDLRALQGDDTTPDLVDLDRDGVVDLVTGGNNGRVVMLRGVGRGERVAVLRAALETHGDRLGAALGGDEPLRRRVFGSLTGLQADLAAGLTPDDRRADLARDLAALAGRFPQVLRRRRFDLGAAPCSGPLAAQFWVVLLEASPATPAGRTAVAEALGFTGGHRRLLVDLGVIFVDNDTAPPTQLDAMERLMQALPRSVWDVETITAVDWLGPAARTQPLRSRTGVNIFAMPLGRTENSFPDDAPRPGVTDVFLICLAHELAHNMLDTVGRRTRPALFERKFAALERAAGGLVAWRTPRSRGIDLEATQGRFREAGAWDGDAAAWPQAWKTAFDGRPEFDRATCRGNVRFFLDAPQEAFATLANQYVADSRLMLEFAKARWDAGHRANADQFLLFAEYLSDGRDEVECYVLRPGGALVVTTATLERDEAGRIATLRTGDLGAAFAYGADDLIERFDLRRDDAAR